MWQRVDILTVVLALESLTAEMVMAGKKASRGNCLDGSLSPEHRTAT